MARQILKGSMVIMLVVGISFLAAAITANGQTPDTRVVADIPFDFIVGDQNLPSGTYNVRKITSGAEGLLISNASTRAAAIRLTNAANRTSHDSSSKLVFHRYGKNYFLAEVWYVGQSEGRLLRESRQERAIERELAATKGTRDVAVNSYERVEIMISGR